MSTEIVRPGGPDLPDSPQSWNARRLQQIAAARFGERDPSFAELLRVVRARKAIIFTICGIVFVAATIVTFVLTLRYESIATIQFNTENADGFGLNSQRGALDDANSTDYSVTQETQVKRLESDTLALEIVKELNLESRPEFYKRQSLLDYLPPRPDETGLPLDRAPYRRTNVESPVELKKILNGKQLDREMQADDILYVPNSFAKAMVYRGAPMAVSAATAASIYRGMY